MQSGDPSSGGISDVFDTIQTANQMLIAQGLSSDPDDACLYVAWVEGGAYLAGQAVQRLATLRDAWGEGSMSKAGRLSEVFSFYLISLFFYTAAQGEASEERQSRAAGGRASLMDIFEAGEYRRHFDTLDEQFWWEFGGSGRSETARGRFVLAMDLALEACGRGLSLDWEEIGLKQPSGRDMDHALPDAVNIGDFTEWLTLEIEASASMMAAYRAAVEQVYGSDR